MGTDIDCICPVGPDGEAPHVADRIELRERLDFRAVDAIKNELGLLYAEDEDAGLAEVLAAIREGYLLHGVIGWTLVDGDGKPLPVTKANIRTYLLTNSDAAGIVADATDDLYRDAVMRPLLRAASRSLPLGQTEDSTSPPTGSSATPIPTPSSPSSTTTTPTDDITTTPSSPDGDSKSLPRWALVGSSGPSTR